MKNKNVFGESLGTRLPSSMLPGLRRIEDWGQLLGIEERERGWGGGGGGGGGAWGACVLTAEL